MAVNAKLASDSNKPYGMEQGWINADQLNCTRLDKEIRLETHPNQCDTPVSLCELQVL